METMDGEAIFVDTNILIFSKQKRSPFHGRAVRRLASLEKQKGSLWISRQILREYLSAMTRPGELTAAVPAASLVDDIHHFLKRFHVADETGAVTEQLLALLERFPVGGKQIHDANIVATMLVHGVPRLLTHNTSDFERYGDLITVLPLVEA